MNVELIFPINFFSKNTDYGIANLHGAGSKKCGRLKQPIYTAVLGRASAWSF